MNVTQERLYKVKNSFTYQGLDVLEDETYRVVDRTEERIQLERVTSEDKSKQVAQLMYIQPLHFEQKFKKVT